MLTNQPIKLPFGNEEQNKQFRVNTKYGVYITSATMHKQTTADFFK